MMIRLIAAVAAGILLLGACNGDDGDGDGDGGASAGSIEEFCGLSDEIESLDEAGEEIDPSDFGALSDQLDESDESFERAAEAAPDEIRDDVELVASAVSDLFDALQGPLRELTENPQAAAQDPEILQQIQEAQPTAEEQEEIDEAQARIDSFLEEECGIDTGSDDADSGTDESDVGEDGGGNPLAP